LAPGASGLRQPSWALADQVRSIDKRRVRRLVGRVSEGELAEIDQALALYLGLVPSPAPRRRPPDPPGRGHETP